MYDTRRVTIGLPEATGAIASGPMVTTVPVGFDEADALFATLEAMGYVSEDGLQLTEEKNTTDIREWGRTVVRKPLDSHDVTVRFTAIQQDETTWKKKYGDSNVSVTASTAEHGTRLKVSGGARLPPAETWVFRMRDTTTDDEGNEVAVRTIIVVPRGQVTNGLDITYNGNGTVDVAFEVSCYPDPSGNCYYVYMDDGIVATDDAKGGD